MLKTVYRNRIKMTVCSDCGKELLSADDWSKCRSQHAIDNLVKTSQGRDIFRMIREAKEAPNTSGVRDESKE